MDSTSRPVQALAAATAISAALLAVELFVAASAVFKVRQKYGLEPAWLLLPLLAAPRLFAGFFAGIALATLKSRGAGVSVLLIYGGFLLWSFNRYELYVGWSSIHAIASGVVPYISGLFGASAGMWFGVEVRRRFLSRERFNASMRNS